MIEGKYFKADANFQLKKCARTQRLHGGVDRRRGEIGVDRISDLPHEIIVLILSFLPLRDAITTSVLSSRWLDLWKYTPNLNFNAKLLRSKTGSEMHIAKCCLRDLKNCTCIDIINSVLQSHKTHFLKEFNISLYLNKSDKCAVSKWLEFLFPRQVERLVLDLQCKVWFCRVVLDELLRDSNGNACRPQTLIFFKSLKKLRLKCFAMSGEVIDLFLRNCLLLEELSLYDCVFTSDVVVCGTTLVLKRLELVTFDSDGSEICTKISAPNLTWLRINTTSEKLLLENVPKLISADFTSGSESLDGVCRFAATAFCWFSQLEYLNLHLLHPKVFLANGCPEMPKLKKLVVAYFGVYGQGLLQVTSLIWASPHLQQFKLEFTDVPRGFSAGEDGLVDNITRRPHGRLKVFEFNGFCDSGDHYEFVSYICDNCVGLEKIIIRCFPYFGSNRLPAAETRAQAKAASGRVKQLLQAKASDHIQLRVIETAPK